MFSSIVNPSNYITMKFNRIRLNKQNQNFSYIISNTFTTADPEIY